MSNFAETLTPQERKRGRFLAYFACYFGCISEVMLDSSAIIIVYISMLGGSKDEVMSIKDEDTFSRIKAIADNKRKTEEENGTILSL